MKIRHLLIACISGLLPLAVQAAAPTSVDRVIVKWRNADSRVAPASDEQVRGVAGRLGQRLLRGRNIGGGMSVMQLGSAQQGATLAATLRALRADPDIELAEPDLLMRIQAYTPSDPLFTGTFTFAGQPYEHQWYLKSGQISSIRADAAWDITRGGTSPATSTVVVAVVDTGVRFDHPDLAGKLLPGYDFVSSVAMANDGSGWDADPSDPGDFVTDADLASGNQELSCETSNSSWHGTRVSGLIAAGTDNAEGIAGTAFNVRVLPVRVLGKCGGYASDVIAGMYWAAGLAIPPSLLQSTNITVNANPAKIINLSLGSAGACSSIYAAAVRDLTDHGVLVVASAGNDGAAVGTPASCPGALAVAGLRHAGTKVGYSNLGPEVSIAAPAGNCVNTGFFDPCLFALTTTTNAGFQSPGSSTYSDPLLIPTYGTSFSSPLVSGTAGLMKTVNPALTPALIIARIRESARAFPSSSDTSPQPPSCVQPSITPVQDAECICSTQLCGAGMLDAHGAVLAALRPAVIATADGIVGANRRLTLDGSRSAAAAGRSIASMLWSVESTSGGASAPSISSATQAVATVPSPVRGSYSIRFTVTDNLGSSDSAIVSVTAAGDEPPAPPPDSGGGGSSGGGGNLSILTLSLAALLLARRLFTHGSVAGSHSRAG